MRIEKINWNPTAAAALFPVMGNDAELLQAEVERGISELFCIDQASYMITRFEGDRLIVVCYIGENLRTMARVIYEAAKKNLCASIQFHTQRPALQRLLSDFGSVCVGQYYVFEVSAN